MIELLLLIWLLCFSYFLGKIILRSTRLGMLSQAENILYASAFGLGALALAMELLGFLGLLYAYIVWPVFLLGNALVLILSVTHKQQASLKLKQSLKGEPLWLKLILGLLALYMGYQLFNCLTPVINGDSIAQYLSIPKHFIEYHGLNNARLTEDYPSSNFPLNLYMLSALGMILKSEILSQLILGWWMSVLCCLAVYICARHLVKREYALLMAAVFYTMPTLSWLIFSAKMDMGYTMFELCFWSLFFRWLKYGENKVLFVSSLFLGLAIGSKYHSLIALSCAALIILIKLFADGKRPTEVLMSVLIFCVAALALGAPSYVKSLYFTGDPFFPFFSQPDIVEGEGYNIYHSISAYPRFLYNMVFAKDPLWKVMNYADKPLGFLAVAFLPLFSLAVIRERKWLRLVILTCVMYFGILSLAIMFSVWPFPRHMLPAVGLLIMLGALGAANLDKLAWKPLIGWVILLFFGLNVLIYDMSLRSINLKWQYLSSRITKQQYLEKTVFNTTWHMNSRLMQHVEELPATARILTLDYGNGYYVSRPFLKKGYVFTETDLMRLKKHLRHDAITHIYLSASGMDQLIKNFNHGQHSAIYTHRDELMVLDYSSGDQALYRVIY